MSDRYCPASGTSGPVAPARRGDRDVVEVRVEEASDRLRVEQVLVKVLATGV